MTDEESCAPLRLGALEQQIMDALWDEAPLSVRELIDGLGGKHAYTTIATVLSNLERKRLVRPEKVGRAVRYVPRCTREMHAARLMRQALSTSNDRAASIVHFIEAIDPRDLRLLRDYLASVEDDG